MRLIKLASNSKGDGGPKKRKGTNVTIIFARERRKKRSRKPAPMVLVVGFESYTPNLDEVDSNLMN